MEEGAVIQPRVLQLNIDNIIDFLPHGKYSDRKKKWEICRRGN